MLDAAALILSMIDVPYQPQAALCLRAGYLALQSIGDYFYIAYPAQPNFPDDPISITRVEFDGLCATLAAKGVPLKEDLDPAWLDFGGWRVNYDSLLVALCTLTMAPDAPWSADRAPAYHPLPLFD